ncbi:amino acid adenylation domain-containing protein [Chitinophaga polysaccharea]|uniref:non-ribosomal peptide synthetase n=1 Tax=Chitinophaga polysaccharea TaxID=1293035 RepID=UPI0014558954|nr:amino acid adenylation domain-containing protein [Chitinophaga polysaccharea]NLR57679.1 amino acid adenylation domain-containing protein [Chitinophaga polysaccharea]
MMSMENIKKDQSLHFLFEEMVLKYPGNTAVIGRQFSISYAGLNEKAEGIKNYLLSAGLQKGAPVAVMMPSCLEAVVALLGILKAGGAFLPIHPDIPAKRFLYLLENSDCKLLLFKNMRQQIPAGIRAADIMKEELFTGQIPVPAPAITGSDLAYILYTSGSTGDPKGVMIEHRSIVNYITWASRTYLEGQQLNFPLFTPLSFDLTLTSVFTPLISGSAIIVFEEELSKINLHRILEHEKVDIIKLTPSHLKMISRLQISRSAVKKFIVGGEALETSLAAGIAAQFPEVEIFNEYGPTETTVGAMVYKYRHGIDNSTTVPLGEAIDHMQVLVLDNQLMPVPEGEQGEIYISGAGLARGYAGSPELTRHRFIDHPYAPNERLYITGDIATVLPGNVIEFEGRSDDLVKINGYRIEPAEIRKILSTVAGVADCYVMARKTAMGELMLCAYYISESEIAVKEMKRVLAGYIPQYMMPAHFIRVKAFQLTSNGKLDKNALPEPGSVVLEEIVRPVHEMEKLLAAYWKEVLELDEVGVCNSFFDIGGNSLKVIEICHLLKADVNESEEDLILLFFKYPTIRSFAAYLRSKKTSGEDEVQAEDLRVPKNRFAQMRQNGQDEM